jgi:hypothetical protein
MNKVVFDIEANGLTPDHIHCLAMANADTRKSRSTTDYDHMHAFCQHEDWWYIGHNIHLYDVPALENILRTNVKGRLVDTLALSWYLYPERIRHGLEEWGEEFGIKKPEISDWENLTPEEYVNRCEQDVQINLRLWDKIWSDLIRLYGSESEAIRILDYLSFKMDCVREQELYGWKLDKEKAEGLRQRLLEEQGIKVAELTKAMPPRAIYGIRKKPNKPYKMDGTLSVAGKEWFELLAYMDLPIDHSGPVKFVKEYEAGNPNSTTQIKDWLFSLGWEPTTFKYDRNDDGTVRKIPQIQQDKTKGPGLCESVKKLFDVCPDLKVLDGLSIINHRLGIVEGFLRDVDEEGYLKAQMAGFTNTLRLKHRTLVNLPGITAAYGEDIRGCLICDDDQLLCGSDLSGLEDRLKQHFIYQFDPEYVKDMMVPDFDPHLDLASSAGAVDQRMVLDYKETGNKTIKAIRHIYKQGNYACQYGAGPPRLALTVGCSLDQARSIYNAYWKRNWAIHAVAEAQVVKELYGQKWLYNPISKLWYSLRFDKDRFSTLVQGSASYCFDVWLKHVRNSGPSIVGQFHDEFIARIKWTNERRMREHVQEAMRLTNEELKLNRELECDIKFGKDYAKIH